MITLKHLFLLFFIKMILNESYAQNTSKLPNNKEYINKMSNLTSTANTYHLDKETQLRLKDLAEKGDIDAAFRLSQYFTLVNKNDNEAVKYLLIGAKNGDVRAQYRVAQNFFKKKLYKDALFWANEAKKNGVEDLDKFIDPDEFINEIKAEINTQNK